MTVQAPTEIREMDRSVWMFIRGELENLLVVQDGILKVRHIAKMVKAMFSAKTQMQETDWLVWMSLFGGLNSLLKV